MARPSSRMTSATGDVVIVSLSLAHRCGQPAGVRRGAALEFAGGRAARRPNGYHDINAVKKHLYSGVAVSALAAVDAIDQPEVCARTAGLRHVDDGMPGIRRLRRGGGFAYVDAGDRPVRDAATLQRIRHLAIPPAWTDVWICPLPTGHLQATGRDARQRKQYRYHDRWREVRDQTKYHRMIAFAQALPAIRRRVAADLARPGLPRERVLAAVVRLLDTALIRVGNDEYSRQNGSYGLTTMRSRHVDVDGARIRFDFRGKSGVHHLVDIDDRRVARVLQRCADLPGQELFQYVDEDGTSQPLSSDDVNAHLRDISGSDFTTKDFRTWAGTVLAGCALHRLGPPGSVREARCQVVEAIAEVSRQLGNTPAVCRRCYVHPDVLAAHAEGSLHRLRPGDGGAQAGAAGGLSGEERAVLRLLRSRGDAPARRRRAAGPVRGGSATGR